MLMFVIAWVKWVPSLQLKKSFTLFWLTRVGGGGGALSVCDMPVFYLALHSLSGVVSQVCPCPVLYISPALVFHSHQTNMSLTANDKKVIRSFWSKIGSQADAIGVNALGR